MGGDVWWCWEAQELSFCLSWPVGACVLGIGTLQKCRPAIVALPCIKSNSCGRDLHLSVIALIKYPSFNATLYLQCVTGDAQGFI